MESLKEIPILLTLARDKLSGELFIFPRDNLCFSLPPPQPAPSAKLPHIPAAIARHWLLGAKPEGNEPAVAAAPDAQIAAGRSVLQRVLPTKRPAGGSRQLWKRTESLPLLFVVNSQIICVRT